LELSKQEVIMYKDLYEANKPSGEKLMTFNEWSRKAHQGGQCSNEVVRVLVDAEKLIVDNWQRTDCTSPDWCNEADINKDGIVNMDDMLSIL